MAAPTTPPAAPKTLTDQLKALWDLCDAILAASSQKQVDYVTMSLRSAKARIVEALAYASAAGK